MVASQVPAFGQTQPWTHYGIRPLGMGNAFVSIADDYNALFYNPAGLARLKEWDGELLNPQLEMSKNTTDFIKDAADLAGGSQDSVKNVLNLIEKETGKNQRVALGITPHLIFPGFGFGAGFDIDANMTFHRYPSVDLDVGSRLILPIAFAFNTLEDRLSLGFAIKLRARGGIDHEFSIDDLEAFIKNNKKNTDGTTAATKQAELKDYVEGGSGVGGDFGLLFTPVKTMEPTFAFAVSDIGSTAYSKFDFNGNALGTPDPQLAAVNTGFSLKPVSIGRMYVRTSIEAHAINQPYSFSKKLNLGLEWGHGEWIKLQTGLHQGYFSAGAQLDIFLLRIALVTYAEELGTYAGSHEDRRYAAQIKFIF